MSWQQTSGAVQGRSFSYSQYRYGFNKEEKIEFLSNFVDAIYDLGFRFYDSCLGRMLSLDPLAKDYPGMSPYSYFYNNPVFKIDFKGLGGGNGTAATHTLSTNQGAWSVAKSNYSTYGNGLIFEQYWHKIQDWNKSSRWWVGDKVYVQDPSGNLNRSENATAGLSKQALLSPIAKGVDEPECKGIDLEMYLKLNFDETYVSKSDGANIFGFKYATNRVGPFQALDWFLDGAGPTNMVFGPSLMWTKNLKNWDIVNKGRKYFYNKYKGKTIDGSSQVDNYIINWGTSEVLTDGANLWRHYIGTAELNIYTSIDGVNLIFVLVNLSNQWSWEYHVGDKSKVNKNRDYDFKYYEDDGKQPKSTTVQIWIWKEAIDWTKIE